MDNLLILLGILVLTYVMYRKLSKRLTYKKNLRRIKILAGNANEKEILAYSKQMVRDARPDTKVRIYSIWKNIKTDLSLTKRWLIDSKYREQIRKEKSHPFTRPLYSSPTIMRAGGGVTGESTSKETIPFAGISKPIEELKEDKEKTTPS